MSFLAVGAFLGWSAALILLIAWVGMRDSRNCWEENYKRLERKLNTQGDDRYKMHSRLQSAEHDLEKLLQLARKIRVKRGKKPGE